MQRVPLYSAVKLNGERLSDRARKGLHDTPKSRVIHIDSIQLLQFRQGVFPEASFRVDCQSGTYIRSLCHDLGCSLCFILLWNSSNSYKRSCNTIDSN